jgi:hypothetical protein
MTDAHATTATTKTSRSSMLLSIGVVCTLALGGAVATPGLTDGPSEHWPTATSTKAKPGKKKAAAKKTRKELSHKVLEARHDQPVVASGKSVRRGKLKLQVAKTRPAHDLSYELVVPLGGGKAEMVVTDLTEGSLARFEYDAEKGSFAFGAGTPRRSLAFNPDGTVSLEGKVYPTPAAAATAILALEDARTISNESWRLLADMLESSEGDTAKVELMIQVTVAVIGGIVGFVSDCAMDVCCPNWCDGAAPWELYCLPPDQCQQQWAAIGMSCSCSPAAYIPQF